MLMPVRCFTCGKVLGAGDLWERFILLEKRFRKEADEMRSESSLMGLEEGTYDAAALDFLGIKRYCCRRMLKTHVDILSKILRCGLKEQKELREAGLAWWKDYDEQADKAGRFEAFEARRREEYDEEQKRAVEEEEEEEARKRVEEEEERRRRGTYSDMSLFKWI